MEAPHGADRYQWKNDRIYHFIHNAVSQFGHYGMRMKAGGKPAVNQIKGHGDEQKNRSQGVENRAAGPHDRNGA